MHSLSPLFVLLQFQVPTQLTNPFPDQLTQLLTNIDGLTASVRPILVPVAQQWALPIITGSLIFWCGKWGVDFVMHRGELVLAEALIFLGKIVLTSAMLAFYNAPIPGIGVAWPDVFPEIAKQIAGIIGVASLDAVLDNIRKAYQGIQHPPAWNFFQLFIYFFVLAGMVLLNGALLVITGLGFWALGLGRIFGPILIVLFPIPGASRRFTSWMNFIWVYSWYRATAAAVVAVASAFMLNFFNNSVAGDYSIDHFTSLFVFMLVNILLCAIACFKTPHWNTELFGNGLGHAGAGAGEAIKNAVMFWAGRG